MEIKLNMVELVEKGYNFNTIMAEYVRPLVVTAYNEAAIIAKANKVVNDARARVAAGNYTSDDLIILQRALNDKTSKLNAIGFESKEAVAASESNYAKKIESSEINEILSTLKSDYNF